MGEWQPIETAPKDGTPILGWAADEEPGWEPMVIQWVEAQTDPESLYVEHDAGWAGRMMFPGRMSDEDDPLPPGFDITHWKPLDPPPGTPSPREAAIKEVVEAAERLTSACEIEFTSSLTEAELPDDQSVLTKPHREVLLTFGMIRDARRALDTFCKGEG